ncbi:hypothetical protein ABTZ03_36480 [Kitasatospora sp. NPDC096077]|uniref:hypothetical protein n=1 Tax=Kitasatospora sp. NPDC096077 TaxID=3155544 RepID=UPI0033314B3D
MGLPLNPAAAPAPVRGRPDGRFVPEPEPEPEPEWIDGALARRAAWPQEPYAAGVFPAPGRTVPREGGVIRLRDGTG